MRLKKATEATVKLGCLGKVKTGMKHPQRGFPMSLDYFRFDSPIVERVKKLEEKFGKEPKSIDITFYSNDMNEVCSQRLELRDKGGRLVAYGDGELFKVSTAGGWEERFIISEDDKLFIKGLQTKYSVGDYEAKFRETLILRFLIIGFPEIGYWELRTYGKETAIPQITSVFDWCLDKFGRVHMIPFTLTVGKHKSNRAEVNRNYSVIQLYCNVGVEAIEAVREWGGVGLLSGDKLGGSMMGLNVPVGDIEEDIEEEVFVEELKEGEEDREVKFLREIKEGLELMNDKSEVELFWRQLEEEYSEEVLMANEKIVALFKSHGLDL